MLVRLNMFRAHRYVFVQTSLRGRLLTFVDVLKWIQVFGRVRAQARNSGRGAVRRGEKKFHCFVLLNLENYWKTHEPFYFVFRWLRIAYYFVARPTIKKIKHSFRAEALTK